MKDMGVKPAVKDMQKQTVFDSVFDPVDPGSWRVVRLGEEVALGQHQENGQAADLGLPAAVLLQQMQKPAEVGEVRFDLFRAGGRINRQHEAISLEDLAGEAGFRAAGFERTAVLHELKR